MPRPHRTHTNTDTQCSTTRPQQEYANAGGGRPPGRPSQTWVSLLGLTLASAHANGGMCLNIFGFIWASKLTLHHLLALKRAEVTQERL